MGDFQEGAMGFLEGIARTGQGLLVDSIERDRNLEDRASLDKLALEREKSIIGLREESNWRMADSGVVDAETGVAVSNGKRKGYEGKTISASSWASQEAVRLAKQDAKTQQEIYMSEGSQGVLDLQDKRAISKATEVGKATVLGAVDAKIQVAAKLYGEGTPDYDKAMRVIGGLKDVELKPRDAKTILAQSRKIEELLQDGDGRELFVEDIDYIANRYGKSKDKVTALDISNYQYDKALIGNVDPQTHEQIQQDVINVQAELDNAQSLDEKSKLLLQVEAKQPLVFAAMYPGLRQQTKEKLRTKTTKATGSPAALFGEWFGVQAVDFFKFLGDENSKESWESGKMYDAIHGEGIIGE